MRDRALNQHENRGSRTPWTVTLALLAVLGAGWQLGGVAADSKEQERPVGSDQRFSELYRFEMVQAAPGKLLELIDLYKKRAPIVAAGGDEIPFLTRHSQGDHWDLLAIYPVGSFTDYYSKERVAKRQAAIEASGVSVADYTRQFYELVAWHQDEYLNGPAVDILRSHVQGTGLVHFEMMQALAGKRDALVEERRMENAFNRGRGRGETLIFLHEQGASWDVITLGVYRNWRQYAESETIPPEVSEAAARKAGFASADGVSPYMRTLIATHRDTLGPPIWLQAR